MNNLFVQALLVQELNFLEDENLYLQRSEKLLIFETDTLTSMVCIFYDVSNL